MSEGYEIVKIPRSLAEEADKFVRLHKPGPEFVKDATRRLITDLSQQEASKKK